MKKRCFILILAIAMAAAFSCTGAPKTPAAEISPPPEEVSQGGSETEDVSNEPPDIAEAAPEEPEEFEEEPDLAEEEPLEEDERLAEEELLEEDELLAEEESPEEDELAVEKEPEPPVVAAVPEPPPPVPSPAPPPQTPLPVLPPQVAPLPTLPPPVPPQPPVLPPQAVPPPAVVQAPEVPPVREPLPRIIPDDIPELPNPTPAFRGRQDDTVVFSRVVRAMVGQLVVVPFRGTGWVYLGEAGSRRGIIYDSRRLDPEGQSFLFRTEEPGEYSLKFYRQDFVRDFILNDYVQAIVGDPPETTGAGWFNPSVDRGRVTAEPRWPSSLEEALALRGDTQPSWAAPAAPADTTAAPAPTTPPVQRPPVMTPPVLPSQVAPSPSAPVAATPPPAPAAATPPAEPLIGIPQNRDPDEYLSRAQSEFNAGRVATAIDYLDRFHELYPADTDEVLWLYGQFYEANSPSRNILTALDYYRRLTREYPQSSRYDAARRRIAYLQRYFINIQ